MAEAGYTISSSAHSDLAQTDGLYKKTNPDLNFVSTHQHFSKRTVSSMSESHGLGYTTNLNAPLYEELANVKRQRDERREYALDVLHRAELEESNKRLKQEHDVKQKIAELQQEAYIIEMAKRKLEAEEQARAAEADARAIEVAKRAQVAREKAAARPPYIVKPITDAMKQEIDEACKHMTKEDGLKVLEIVREEDPDVAEPSEDEYIQLREDTSPITISKVHDFVEAYYPKYVKFPTTRAALPAPPTATGPAPGRQLAPTASIQRQASPPRNIKNFALGVPGTAGGSYTTKPQAQIGGGTSSSMNSGNVDVSAIPPQTDATRLFEIHAALKKFRGQVKNLSANNKGLKAIFSNIRQDIKKRTNQISKNPKTNPTQATELRNILLSSLRPTQAAGNNSSINIPTVDPNQFLAAPRNNIIPVSTLNDAELPMTFIYALNMLVKATCKKFTEECSTDPAQASFVGTIISGIFSMKEFQWRGGHFMDIMQAKFRKALPVVYGIRGSESTVEGRDRIGWRRHKTANGQPGDFYEAAEHYDRMTGLAAGFAALALRDYTNAPTRVNPFPPHNWWWGMTAIVNTPENDTTATLFTVLRFMIEGYEQSLFNIFGDKGKDQLYTSLVVFPYKGYNNPEIKNKSAVKAVEAFAMKLHKEKGLLQPPVVVKMKDQCDTNGSPVVSRPQLLSPVFGAMPGVRLGTNAFSPTTVISAKTLIGHAAAQPVAQSPMMMQQPPVVNTQFGGINGVTGHPTGNPVFGTATAPQNAQQFVLRPLVASLDLLTPTHRSLPPQVWAT